MKIVTDKTGLNIDNYFIAGKTFLKNQAFTSLQYSIENNYVKKCSLAIKTYQL